MRKFDKWIDTFNEEKGINLERIIEIEGQSGLNMIPVSVVIEHMKIAPQHEQEKIKDVIVKIDFANGNVNDFYDHLAKAIAK